MSLTENILNILRCTSCSLIVQNAVILKCGANCCRKCINNSYNANLKELKCNYCSQTHKIEECRAKMQSNPHTNILISTFLNDLVHMLKSEFTETIHTLDLYTNEAFNKKIEFIEEEIELRIESVKNRLDDLWFNLKQDIERIKSNWFKRSTLLTSTEDIKLTKDEFDRIDDIDTFFQTQNKLNELKKLAKKCQNDLSKLTFQISDFNIDSSVIGKLEYPFEESRAIKNLSKVSTVKLSKSKDLWRITLLNDLLYISDFDLCKIHIISIKDAKLIQSLNPNGILLGPLGICSSKTHIIVGDCIRNEILVFDSTTNMLLVKKFGRSRLKGANYMCLDDTYDRLFVSDWFNNEITVWNVDDGEFLFNISIDSPAAIKFSANRLYALSSLSYLKDTSKHNFIKKGSNCLFVLNIYNDNYTKEEIIKFSKWIDPRGLFIDTLNDTLITSAHELDSSNNILSPTRYLYTIDQTGTLINKLKLTSDLFDFIYENNELVTCFNNEIKHYLFAS